MPIVFKFEMGQQYESSDFGRLGFFRRGEMTAQPEFRSQSGLGECRGLPDVLAPKLKHDFPDGSSIR